MRSKSKKKGPRAAKVVKAWSGIIGRGLRAWKVDDHFEVPANGYDCFTSRKAARCRYESVVPVIIADARHYKVVPRPSRPKKSRPRSKGGKA